MRFAVPGHYRRAVAILVIAAMAGFVLMAALVVTGITAGMDGAAYEWAVGHQEGALLVVATGFTELGYAQGLLPVAFAATLIMVFQRRWALAVLPLLVLVIAYVTDLSVKCPFARTRPVHEITLTYLTPCDQFSFPSGHATNSAALYSLLVFLVLVLSRGSGRWALAGLLALMPLFIGLSRVVLEVHWMSDVVAGWALGVLMMGTVLLAWCWMVDLTTR